MDLPILNLSALANVAVFVCEHSDEKRTRFLQTFATGKDNVPIVTNERSSPLYETFQNVQTTYDANKYNIESLRGSTCIFDDCFTDTTWVRDTTLLHLISYPRMLGLTSVFGFTRVCRLPPRMCWNLDLICIGATPSPKDRELLRECFFLYRFSYDEFCELLDNVTKGNGFLVLRREGPEEKLYQAYG